MVEASTKPCNLQPLLGSWMVPSKMPNSAQASRTNALPGKISAACEPLLRSLDAAIMLPGTFGHLGIAAPLHLASITTPRLGLHVADLGKQRGSQRIIVGARTEQRMLPRLAPSGAVEGLDRCKLLVGERLAVASIPQRLRSTVKLDHLIGEQELTRSASGPSHGSSFQQDDRQPLSVPGSLPGARCICSRTLGRLTHHAAADWP